MPVLDHGHQTDILISDRPNYFRVQVKTVGAASDDYELRNQWKGSNVSCVVFFARNSNWGCVTPAFEEDRRPMNHPSHQRSEQSRKEFLKAFHKVEV